MLPETAQELPDSLVRISGWERSDGGLKIGKDNTNERLRLALRILQTLRRNPAWLSPRLVELNVADPQQIRFVIALPVPADARPSSSRSSTENGAQVRETVEVRCGSEAELEANLRRLQASLETVGSPPLSIKYIDVRFPESVIAPQT